MIIIFPNVQVSEQRPTNELGDVKRSFVFDFETGQFQFKSGVLTETTPIEAIKQWVELYIRVEKDKYKIYSSNFGTDFSDLVGYRLPRSYQVSEIIRRMDEGIKRNCPNVVNITDWNFDNGTFSFTLHTNTGEEVTLEL